MPVFMLWVLLLRGDDNIVADDDDSGLFRRMGC